MNVGHPPYPAPSEGATPEPPYRGADPGNPRGAWSGANHLSDHDHADYDHAQGYEADAPNPAGGGQWLVKAALFWGMAAYFLYLWWSGNLGNYINARFMWLSVVAALLFAILGSASLYAAVRIGRGGSDPHHDLHTPHVHPRLTWPVWVLLAVPLLLGIVIPSRPLGASAVGDGDLVPVSPSERSLAPAGGSTEWTVVDWLRVFHYAGNPDRLNGREADVVGFVFRRNGDPPGHFMVARFMMSCCSADSYAIGLPVAWASADTLATDTWVRVQGPVRVAPFGKNTLPIVDARSVDPSIGKPPQPYLYP